MEKYLQNVNVDENDVFQIQVRIFMKWNGQRMNSDIGCLSDIKNNTEVIIFILLTRVNYIRVNSFQFQLRMGEWIKATIKQNIQLSGMSLEKTSSRNSIGLDLSNHNLNNSSSKQKFSFPKSNRFSYEKSLCDSFYEIPNSRAQRSTSFGYGQKDMGIRTQRYQPEPATYNIESEFNQRKRGTSFGPGREEMALGGPLRDSVSKKFVPGPGNYSVNSTLQPTPISMKSRLPDKSQEHLKRNPGPGAYGYEELGTNKYYITSRHPNRTNSTKISPSSGHGPLNAYKTLDVGPGQYNPNQTDIKPDGRYVLAKDQSSKSRVFSKSPRESIVYKHLLSNPGVGSYTPFTYFGPS